MSVPPIRHPYGEVRPDGSTHRGEDYTVPVGTELGEPADGLAWSDDEPTGYGLHARLWTPNGETLIRGHLSWTDLPRGDQGASTNWGPPASAVLVSAGEMRAKSGNSGHSSGPHVHLEARMKGYTSTHRVWRVPSRTEAFHTFTPEEDDMPLTDADKAWFEGRIKQAVTDTVTALAYGRNGPYLPDEFADEARANNIAKVLADLAAGGGGTAPYTLAEIAEAVADENARRSQA